MENRKDAVEENVIQEHDRIRNHGKSNYMPRVTFYLKSIQKVIKERIKFVLDMKTITDEYDRNKKRVKKLLTINLFSYFSSKVFFSFFHTFAYFETNHIFNRTIIIFYEFSNCFFIFSFNKYLIF